MYALKLPQGQKRQDKLKAIPITISAVYNYSKITLTPGMTSLLNKGLNFCVTPIKLNLAELIVDLDKFDRRTLWQRDKGNRRKTGIFSKKENYHA